MSRQREWLTSTRSFSLTIREFLRWIREPTRTKRLHVKQLSLLLSLLFPSVSHAAAQDSSAVAPALDSGDTAWIIVATALVLFMTIPGLSMFYAGLVRQKNVLSVFMHCFVIT